jgi:hypothetical protein
MPVGQSNTLRVTLDTLIGNSNTPKDVVFLNVAIFPHGHKYDRNNSKQILPKAE